MIPLKEKKYLYDSIRLSTKRTNYIKLFSIDTIQFSFKTFFPVFDTYRNNCAYTFKTSILYILVRRTIIRANNLDNNSTRTNKHLEAEI